MSSLLNIYSSKFWSSPYFNALLYWSKKPMNKRFKILFLLTKVIEIYAFRKNRCKTSTSSTSRQTITTSVTKNEVCDIPIVSVIIPTYIKDNFEKNFLFRLIDILRSKLIKYIL